MNLFTNGCSFTWGGSIYPKMYDSTGQLLDYYNTSELNQERLSRVWPGQLAQLMNAESCVNLALTCASNERIVRTTLEFFLNPENQNKQWLAIIQWSLPERFEFWSDENNCWAVVSPQWVTFNNPQSTTPAEATDAFLKHVYGMQGYRTYAKKFWTQLVTLSSFFQSRGIDYRYTRLMRLPHEHLDPWQTEYAITQLPWIGDGRTHDFGQMFDPENKMPMGHPTALGHEQVAQFIWNSIKNDYSN